MQLIGALLASLAALAAQTGNAPEGAIRLDPLTPGTRVEVNTVSNYYGRCGGAVVQVLGVRDATGDTFGIDAAAEGQASIAVLAGDRGSLTIRKPLSDYNGVACLNTMSRPLLLIWSNCGGSACGDDFSFTVGDVEGLRILAGNGEACDTQCAARLTGSTLPLRLNGH